MFAAKSITESSIISSPRGSWDSGGFIGSRVDPETAGAGEGTQHFLRGPWAASGGGKLPSCSERTSAPNGAGGKSDGIAMERGHGRGLAGGRWKVKDTLESTVG